MLLENKVAVVTGGSRGIGYATVEAFIKEGAKVVLCASRQETADKAVGKLKEACPDAAVEGIWPDLSDYSAVKAAIDAVVEKYGRIDILVNNAGVSDLNVKGVFNCSRAASEHMVAAGSGVILNTSSMVSQYGQPAGIAYPTSKFAVNGFTLSLARELGPKGVRVNAVAPGITYTEMMRSVPKEVIEPMIAQIPLRRMGQPEDIANAFVFLASDMASYISGEVLHVDGLART